MFGGTVHVAVLTSLMSIMKLVFYVVVIYKKLRIMYLASFWYLQSPCLILNSQKEINYLNEAHDNYSS